LEVDRQLRRQARQRGISLNQLPVEELTRVASRSETRVFRSLARLAGRWVDDPEFDRILQEQRQIDGNL